MHTIFGGIVIIVASSALSVAGLWIRRRFFPLPDENEAVAGYFAVIGVVYGVISAFVIFLVWGDFEEARQNVAREANQIVDLYLITRSLPPPFPEKMKQRLLDYTHKVAEIEWDLLAEGKSDPTADQAYRALWQAFEEVQMTNPREIEVYSRALGQMNDLSDSRRLRIHASRATIPPMIWAILLSGAVITIFFSYFFEMKRFVMQACLTAGLTTSVVLMLFLILSLDRPFTGDIRIAADPFRTVLERIQAVK